MQKTPPNTNIINKKILFLFIFLFALNGIKAQTQYRLPKVLFVTSGADQGRGTVSDGIVVALQAFNRLGVFVRLENKQVLLQPEKLSKYDILILPTISGYHDKPHKNALTYLSDMALQNISQWVRNGGTLLTDVNIGRNTLNGTDRYAKDKVLNVNNWQLGRCFGVALKEVKVSDFYLKDTQLHIWKKPLLKSSDKEHWQLVPVETTTQVKTPLVWQSKNQSYPALTIHNYGSGKAILLPTFKLLHPVNDGGLSTENQISGFYQFVFDIYTGKKHYDIKLSPWKDGYVATYCQTFDDGGNLQQYERIFKFIRKNKLPTIFFVTPHINQEISQRLMQETLIDLQGHSYNHPDFRKLDYTETFNEFLMNRQFWNKKFTGFRFPYVSNSFWGLYALDKLGFTYDTSIAANNMEFIRGSVVPYNIPIFNDDFYLTLNLLEISQIYKSDWYFYQDVLEKKPYTLLQQQKDAQRFQQYLFQYFDEVVQPNKGVMVYLGHPMYSGISDTTLQPLQKLIDYLRQNNVWIASLNEVAQRWNIVSNLDVLITENNNIVSLELDAKDKNVNGLTFVLNQKPKKISSNDAYKLKEYDGKYILIFDLKGTSKITITY